MMLRISGYMVLSLKLSDLKEVAVAISHSYYDSSRGKKDGERNCCEGDEEIFECFLSSLKLPLIT